jgi:hypothetical protein
VLGVLNTWHLTQFQRFYGSLDAALRRDAHSGERRNAGGHVCTNA